jgi:hypothetical protein
MTHARSKRLPKAGAGPVPAAVPALVQRLTGPRARTGRFPRTFMS